MSPERCFPSPWALAALLGLVACRDPSAPPPVQISKIEINHLAAGLDLVEVDLKRGQGPGGTGLLLYADPQRFSAEIVINERRQPLAKIAPEAISVTNCAFFTPDWKPTGLLVSNGKVLNRFVKEAGGAGSGVFVIEDRRAQLLERDQVGSRSFDKAELAIQAGPRIIEAGGKRGIRSDDGVHAHRTIIGTDPSDRFVLGVFVGPSGFSSGLSLYELQSLLGAKGLGKTGHPELVLTSALNLDGGPSTGMHVRHPEHRIDRPEASAVYSALALRPLP